MLLAFVAFDGATVFIMMFRGKTFRSSKYIVGLLFGCARLVLTMPLLSNYYDDIWDGGDGAIDIASNETYDVFTQRRDPKVLNFFPIPVEEECASNDGRRKGMLHICISGVCMNTYECRIQGGSSRGFCALGFGVCCVFTATCDQDIYNNITYFVNPHFPDLSLGMSTCNLKIKKIDSEVAQIRLDFIHFNLGQPNRYTGICDDDVFIVSGGGSKDLTLCGLNSGQHVYFDVENVETPINVTINLNRRTVARLWEVRVEQIPFVQRSPVGCLQYHTGSTGVIQTMNFAENGRHLANQDYNICTRQEEGTCSIVYEPCDENSFRIGPNLNPEDQEISADTTGDFGSGDGGLEVAETRGMEMCADKIVMPCNSDDLIMPGDDADPSYCNIARCGDSLCPPNGGGPCKIESSTTPFTIGVHFGPSSRAALPDDNLGMCLTYQQLPCIED